MKRRTLLLSVAVLIVAAVAAYFLFRPKPIKVALVNYPTFMVTRMITSAEGQNAKVKVEDDLKQLSGYDAVLLWGMGGAKWNDEDRETIQALDKKKIPYCVVAATNPQNNLSNLQEEQRSVVMSYVFNGGVKNYRSLFNFIRQELLTKSLREGTVEAPIVYGDNTFFGKTDDHVFESLEKYQEYYTSYGYKEGAPKVALLIGFASPFISNRDHVDSIVSSLEEKGLNVYPFSSGIDRVAILEAINPDLIVYIPHGRMLSNDPDKGAEWLKTKNVPVLTAITVMTTREKWLKDKQGLVGGFLGQSVASPEFDGVMVPYALISLEDDPSTGLQFFKAMPERLKPFTELVCNYIDLAKKDNREKKVAIFYFKGPGQNSLVAQGIEVLPSLYNVLINMQQQGYNVDGLPASEKEFEELIMARGCLFNTYSEGAISDFITKKYPVFIPTDSLTAWMKEVLTKDQCASLKEKYGEAPGLYFTAEENGKEGIVVTRVRFGNIVLLPQPGQGVGENDFKAVHGSNPVPPYPYMAAYLWAQKGFGAHALAHFGTHGSLEFINGKQIALSEEDWTDRFVNQLPHVYYYTIANVGEAMIAKRRSYGQTVSYLAPPFIETRLRGQVSDFLKLTDQYLAKEEDDEKLSLQIKTEAIKAGYHRDLRLDSIASTPYSRLEVEQLSNFAEEMAISKIPGGMYVTGIPFTEEKILSSVKMIANDPIAYGVADLDLQRGAATDEQQKSERFFTQRYRNKSAALVNEILAGGNITPEAALLRLGVTQTELNRAEAFLKSQLKAAAPMIMDRPSQANTRGTNPEQISKGEAKSSGMPKGHPVGIPKGGEKSGEMPKGHPVSIPKGGTGGGHPSKAKKEGRSQSQLAGVPTEQLQAPKGALEFEFDPADQHLAVTISGLKNAIANIKSYYRYLKESPQLELKHWMNALNGGFTTPSPGGDYIANPQTIPTGRNLFSINAETTPSETAWKKGKEMANAMLEDYQRRHGEFPKKVSFSLWSSSFIESEGATIAEIIYLVGCEPVRDPMGRIQDVRLIPREKLGRKRVDVVVQTSGQFRDLAASRLYLIQKAVDLAVAARGEEDNELVKGAEAAEKVLLEKGLTPHNARAFSTQRVFGGVNGNYGTGIQEMVEAGDRWENESEIAKVYLNNMGAIYGDPEKWGDFTEGLFEAALQRTDAVVHPRQSNTWGPLSLDHVYEFMGGLTITIRDVTGKDPEGYFNDLRNQHRAKVTELKQSIGTEARTTILNPTYVAEVLKDGQGAANAISETIRNTYGWNVMKPSAIDKELWDGIFDTYVADVHNLGIKDFFDTQNPAAMQELTAVMLETVRKGMWKASPEQIQAITDVHATSVKEHGAGCSGFVCDNAKLRDFISSKLDGTTKEDYKKAIAEVREVSFSDQKAQRLKRESEKESKNRAEGAANKGYIITYVVASIVLILLIIALVVRRRRARKA